MSDGQSDGQNRVFWLRHQHFDFGKNAAPSERAAFSLRAVYDVVAAPNWRIAAPVQAWNEIWLVQKGRVEIELNGQRAVVCAGEIGVLAPRPLRDTREMDGRELAILGFSFDANLLGTFEILNLLQAPLRVVPDASTRARVESALRNCMEESREARAGFSLAAQSWAQIAFVETVRAMFPESEIESRLQAAIRKTLAPEVTSTLDFIAAHFDSHIELETLARRAHLSPSHFARKFKNATGCAPMEYLRNFRLQSAQSFLASSDASISEVAARCGFPDAAHFSRAFKEFSGASPLEFRRQTRAFHPKNERAVTTA